MADVDLDRFGAGVPAQGAPASGFLAQAVSLSAAAVSVALVAGLALWGYRLAVRDVAGVPVVRAMEGPMRIAPDDPGGDVAAHLGLAVNAVAAEGGTGALADRLVLAPAPVGLADEDAAGTLAALAPPVSGRSDGATALALPPFGEDAPAAPAPTQEDAIAAALAEALGQDPAVVSALVSGATELSGTLDGVAPPAGPRSEAALPRGAVVSAVRPRARPGSIAGPADALPEVARTDAAPAEAPLLALAPAAELDPAALPAGTRLVQLGAFETADLARAEWDRVAGRFADLMAGKARVVQEAQSGGRAFWRLRAAGFETEAEARRFCADLLAGHTACIPVTLR